MNSNNNQSYLLKLQCDNEVRRFRVENESFEQFLVIVQNILKINPSEYEFFYNDNDGDEIKFSSDVEFGFALSTSPSPLRILLKKIEKINTNNEINLRELISEVDQISVQEMKEKMKEINQKIKTTEEAANEIKISIKEKRGEKTQVGYFSELNENEKQQKFALFQYSLELYELKLIKRSLFMQLKSLHKFNCKREFKNVKNSQEDNNNINNNINNNTNINNEESPVDCRQLRQSIWELKEKAKSIKVQIRSVKLLMNSMNSETQKSDLQKQLIDLKTQLIQLKEEKIKLCSQFKYSRRRFSNNNNIINNINNNNINNNINNNNINNNINNNDLKEDVKRCRKNWKGKGNFTPEEREQRKEECKQRRDKIISIRKRIIEIKSTRDFQKNDQSVEEINSLKQQIQILRLEQQANSWKRHCNFSTEENKQ